MSRLRLRRAGCERELFASDAIGLLHEATLGAMRDIDRLAAAASASASCSSSGFQEQLRWSLR